MALDTNPDRKQNRIIAEKATGETKEFILNKKDQAFSQGTRGIVYHAKASSIDPENPYIADLVVKDYASKAGEPLAAEKAQHSVEAFGMLRDAGIVHLPTTCRLITPGGTSVLMTNFNSHGYVAFGHEQKKITWNWGKLEFPTYRIFQSFCMNSMTKMCDLLKTG